MSRSPHTPCTSSGTRSSLRLSWGEAAGQQQQQSPRLLSPNPLAKGKRSCERGLRKETLVCSPGMLPDSMAQSFSAPQTICCSVSPRNHIYCTSQNVTPNVYSSSPSGVEFSKPNRNRKAREGLSVAPRGARLPHFALRSSSCLLFSLPSHSPFHWIMSYLPPVSFCCFLWYSNADVS